MIKTEFGIIDEIDADKDYSHYEPEKYNCVYIDDDIYIDEWWEQLQTIKTFYHSLNRPGYALARYGVTIIPPDRKSTRLNSSHIPLSRMPSSA